MSDVGVGVLRKGHVLVDFVDQYGDKRTIHKTKGTRLSVKRQGNTPVHALNRAAVKSDHPQTTRTPAVCPQCGDQTWTCDGAVLCASSGCGWDTLPHREVSPWEDETDV